MSNLKGIDRKILEKYFRMEGDYVLDFSNRTMEEFFIEEFEINIYDNKYDNGYSDSKANRLRGIWREESDEVVGKIILSLMEYEEISQELNETAQAPNLTLRPRVQSIANKLLKQIESPKENTSYTKSQNDYIVEIVNFFKEEYQKTKLPGLTYDYVLGNNIDFIENRYPEPSPAVHQEKKRLSKQLQALKKLQEIGLIQSFEIKEWEECPEDDEIYDIAKCSIDESKLNNSSSDSQKIIHEHKHKFENNIQENPIDLNIKMNPETTTNSKTKPTFLHKIPAGTDWSHITIAFDDDENISIAVRGLKEKTNFDRMGFVDNRTGKPNTQWELLKILAKNNGSLRSNSPQSKEKYKKQKQLLSDKLKEYFTIDYDPFKSYDTQSGYELKMTIFYKENEEIPKEKPTNNPFDDLGDYMKETIL